MNMTVSLISWNPYSEKLKSLPTFPKNRSSMTISENDVYMWYMSNTNPPTLSQICKYMQNFTLLHFPKSAI